MIDDLENTHHDESASTSKTESSGNEESEGETDEDLSDYEREERRKQHSGMV